MTSTCLCDSCGSSVPTPQVPATRWVCHSTRTANRRTVRAMSNESTPQVPAEQPEPVLPQFDPSRPPTADDTQQLPTASTSEIPVTPPDTPYAYAASPSQAGP